MGERAPKREVRINWHIGSAVAAAQLHPPVQDFPDLDFRRRRWIIKPLRFESSVRFAATASRATQRKRKHRIALIVSMATGTNVARVTSHMSMMSASTNYPIIIILSELSFAA